MQTEVTFVAALMVGFVGSTHCIGMCGGIAGATGLATDPRTPIIQRTLYPVLYNIGRILSYVVAGYLAASVAGMGFGLVPTTVVRTLASGFTFIFLVSLGFYLAGWWSFLPKLEALGGKLWRVVEPLGRRLLPIRDWRHALLFGLIWGWLPCGLVYSALAWAFATGQPSQGALLMLGFGLGTLPTLLCLGMAGQILQRVRKLPLARRIAGVSLIVLAGAMLVLNDHETSDHHPDSHTSM